MRERLHRVATTVRVLQPPLHGFLGRCSLTTREVFEYVCAHSALARVETLFGIQ
jgi:hypothetical protein